MFLKATNMFSEGNQGMGETSQLPVQTNREGGKGKSWLDTYRAISMQVRQVIIGNRGNGETVQPHV